MNSISMSYSLLVMTYDRIYALRDPYGNRPLCVGSTRKPFAFVAASETCAIQSIAEVKCEVKAGEIVEISRHGIRSIFQMHSAKPSFCIFEYVYFARADSIIGGRQVQSVREECGRILADESYIEADVVSTVPDSASAASIGFAKQSGIRYEQVLHRNSYVGRSFIQPSTELRQKVVLKKFGVISENVIGKRIILVDDSIVRGNTMAKIVRMLKAYGAKEYQTKIAQQRKGVLRHSESFFRHEQALFCLSLSDIFASLQKCL
ncbi:unnamed protein product [Anisakis simplex]|uniref:Glutamine amidotransferase type-2 domain-containing protein n=1 Tax=Anisakis simplex TaxID=6269 RepID=A0A0M3J566_ANISI|nr:unnamed protein product [Anisakis simplex]